MSLVFSAMCYLQEVKSIYKIYYYLQESMVHFVWEDLEKYLWNILEYFF